MVRAKCFIPPGPPFSPVSEASIYISETERVPNISERENETEIHVLM